MSPIYDPGLLLRICEEVRRVKGNYLFKKWAIDLNRIFSKEEIKILRDITKSLLAIAIRKMQIKTTLKFYLTPMRMGKINKTDKKC